MNFRIDRLGSALLVCIAACSSNDPAPPAVATAGSAATAPRMNPEPSAAGAPAAAAGSGGAALAAAASGVNASAAPNCELPNTYTRAARFTLELKWPETLGIVGGTGTLVMWSKVTYTRGSNGVFELEARPCGALMPAATTTILAGGLMSSVQIPDTAFESPKMPVERMTATQGEDRSLTFAYGTVLGAMLPDPNGAWPSSASLVPFDHDGDGAPGVSALPLEGPEYATVPSSISQLEFLDRLYFATRTRLQVSITPACSGSGSATGTVDPLSFNFNIIGCHVKDRGDCEASELRFIVDQGNRYMLGASPSGAWTEVEVPHDASCAAVRGALPVP